MPHEALDVGVDLPRDLQLVIAVAVRRDDLFEAFRQPVVDPLAVGLGARQRIDQPDGVARMDRRRGREAAEQLAEIEARQVGRGRGIEPEPVRFHQRKHRSALQPSERIDDRAVDQRQPERRDQSVQPNLRAGLVMRSIDRGRQAERRVAAGGEQRRARHRERDAQLIEIVLVRQVRRLVEPFRRQDVGRDAFALAPVGELDRARARTPAALRAR